MKRVCSVIFICLLGIFSTSAQNLVDWKIARYDSVKECASLVSSLGFDDSEWIPARVPGTILTDYLRAGSFPDPNFGDNQLLIPDSLFVADFWYRTEFLTDKNAGGNRVWLNFDGVNWKADIFLNGSFLDSISGAFLRKKVDVTEFVRRDSPNSLAVLVHKNDNPGEVTVQHLDDPDDNGGIIGYDSPTFLASIGWNWMPTIRGRNAGIWNDVYVSYSGDVKILDPFVKTILPLPDTTRCELSVETYLENSSPFEIRGTLVVSTEGIDIGCPVTLKGGELKHVKLDKDSFPELCLDNPKLWWPNGYGNQPLYDMSLKFVCGGGVSDVESVTFGVRQYSYSVMNNNLKISVNGFPVVVRGGNWGMAESMLRCGSAFYDTRVFLHKQMNMNMIRNWIGMVGDDEFYDACDRYGIMVWDDFWLANPVDGPHPKDEDMFMDNVRDKIRHFRNHASVAVWNGRNEGYPPATLDSAMRCAVIGLDGTRLYLSHSAAAPVSGLGPYENMPPEWYFKERGKSFHSEQGIVAPPTLEGFKAMMEEKDLWPINDMWGLHDWTQPRVRIFTEDLNRKYGEATGIEDFCRKAQMMNMEASKAMMESWQSNRGGGVMVWMSHPAWPSLICQSYDYYLEPTAAYFGFKKANEPVHILWRADDGRVQVVNNTLHGIEGFETSVELYDVSGARICSDAGPVSVPSNSISTYSRISSPLPGSDVCFIRLLLKDGKGKVVSSNFYWTSGDSSDYRELNRMKNAAVDVAVLGAGCSDGKVTRRIRVTNCGDNVALMLRLLLVDRKSGKRVLPVFYEDNFFSLVPGESRELEIRSPADGHAPGKESLFIEGWNLERKRIK